MKAARDDAIPKDKSLEFMAAMSDVSGCRVSLFLAKTENGDRHKRPKGQVHRKVGEVLLNGRLGWGRKATTFLSCMVYAIFGKLPCPRH